MTHFPSRRPVHVAADHDQRDQGSILPMILALMVVGSLAVVALLTFATTLFSNRPPIEVRDRTFWSAKSAMSMAMVLQKAHGPDGCYTTTTDRITLNGYVAEVRCDQGAQVTTGRGRFAIITTGNDATTSSLIGRGVGSLVKPITGDVFANAGLLNETSRDLAATGSLTLSNYAGSPLTPAARYTDYTTMPQPQPVADCASTVVRDQAAAALPSTGVNCVATPWWESAGDVIEGVRTYPLLPPLPLYERPSIAQARIPASGPNACQIYFPGQYTTELRLGAGDHYFTSGVYYFAAPLVLEPGARVVAGSGRYSGCTVDAEAAFAATAPRAHNITGAGATFVFGAAGKLVTNDASLRMNRRVSDASTRGSDTIAIRSVNFEATPLPAVAQLVQIPDDRVLLLDTFTNATSCDATISTTSCIQPVATYTSQVTAGAPLTRYSDSTLGVTDSIVEVNQLGGTASSNQFVVDGYVFVPNAKVTLNGGTNADARLRMTGGVVASSLDVGYNVIPANSSNWYLGVLSEAIQLDVDLTATVTAPNQQRTISRATLQVNQNGAYAINGWTVDPNAGVAPTTTSTTTTTTTTLPPVITDPTTTTTTTAPTTTTTTTTTLPPPVCVNDTAWNVRYWDNKNLSGNAVGSNQLTDLNFDLNWAGGRPVGVGVTDDDTFSAEFTRTVTFPSPGRYQFNIGSDDGTRLDVRGQRVHDMWSNQGYGSGQRSVVVDITDPCAVPIKLEYYENTGQARVSLNWTKVG
jgi:hypothetical protein